MRSRHGAALALVLAFVLVMAAACTDDDDAATTTAATAAPTTTAAPATTTTAPPPTTTTVPEPGEPPLEVPNLAAWAASGHADATAEAFRHWDEDDPAVVPASCAKCHSDGGYKDFVGADGSAFGVIDAESHPIDTTITCTTCHNEGTANMTSVVMPSGAELTGLGREAVCMQCHQGRESGVSIAAAVEGLDEDTASEDLGFLNIHYYPAAATKYGTEAMGGYQYEGKTYDAFFTHVEGYSACADCHDPHALELKVDECAACHTQDDPKDIRHVGSLVDYDGDGDMAEGIYYEIEGLQANLYAAMQAYAADVLGTGLVYDSHSYPYFFVDLNGDGAGSEDEVNFGNRFATWSPRLLKAAHNYQMSVKDPGGYAHNGKYIIQLLVDSTDDLNSVLPTPIAVDAVHRIDHGHFAGSEEAFRHWDEDGAVPASCAKCHSAEGLPTFLAEGVNVSQPTSNGLLCSTCHNDLSTFSRYEVADVEFPSGATVSFEDADANLCINCHQGRSSSASVAGAIAGIADDAVSENLRFINIHYFAAGATLFGSDASGGYEYPGQEYVGQFGHVDSFNSCAECHNAHSLEVEVASCGGCHAGVESAEDLASIRISEGDFDGDGDATEGLAGEIATMIDALYAAMQEYALGNADMAAVIYDSHTYPYFFIDSNENGESDPGEAIYPNAYNTWTPRLVRAAYIFQYAQKDPGGFAHNGKYVIQMLYDALADLDAAAGMTRP